MKKLFAIYFALVFLLCSCGDRVTVKDTEKITDSTESTAESMLMTEESAPLTEIETEVIIDTESEPVTTEPEPVEIITPVEMFVTINEVCAANVGCFTDMKGENPDWIELYNASDKAVNLAGYGISDDAQNPMKYTFSNYLIEADSYVILLASGNVGYQKGVISLPFKLSADGETLTLTSPDGLKDIFNIPELEENETYGRATDGGDLLCHLTPTPLATNNNAQSIIKVPSPRFSHSGGFYMESIELSISIPENCVVYYTTDGSVPTAESEIYGEPISLADATFNPNVYSAIAGTSPNNFVTQNNQDKAHVIRAIAIDREGNISKVTSSTFFVQHILSEDSYKDMPILSVYTDGDNLFDYESGIYVLGKTYDDYMNGEEFDSNRATWSRPANYYFEGAESERPATIEYFDSDHKPCFIQNVGIRIGGNTSRSNPQKSFKFYARSEYGKDSFSYPMFDGVSYYDTFIMRSGANDYSRSKIRDVLAQSLVSGRDISTAKWQPCVMFLNGEYWGFYMMMERYDSDYFRENYHINKDDLVVIKTGEVDIGNEEDKELYRELRRFCKNNDLTLSENYEKLCSMIDMQSYIDYVCFNIIINNSDWPGNNTSLWRVRNVDPSNPYADGRWRWASYDTERSMLLYGTDSSEDYDKNTYEKLVKNGVIFGYVYKNEEFKKHFLATLMDMLAKNFEYSKIEAYLSYFEENFDIHMRKNRERYNTASDYSKEIEVIRVFWQNRSEYLLKYTCELFETDPEIKEIVVKTENGNGCGIDLYEYSLPLEEGRYSCEYFVTPLKFTARSAEGYRFAGWKISDGSVISVDDVFELDPCLYDSLTAVFEPEA